MILKPTWRYEHELWGSTKPSNLSPIQSLQSMILRKIAKALYYVSNIALDFHVPFLKDFSITRYNIFHSFLRLEHILSNSYSLEPFPVNQWVPYQDDG
jgi:hypothetical protein